MRNYVITFSICVLSVALSAAGDDTPKPADSASMAGFESLMYFRHARDKADILLTRVQGETPTAQPVGQEFVSGIAADMKTGVKSLEQLATRYEKDDAATKQISAITKRNAKIQDLCARLAAEYAKKTPDARAIVEASKETSRQCSDAATELSDLIKTLKIVRQTPGSTTPKADAAATFGNGFRPHSAELHLRSILDNSKVLDRYADTKNALPQEAITEHMLEIERQLAALKAENAKLDAAFRKEQNLDENMKTVENNQAQLQARIADLRKRSETRQLNPAEVRETSQFMQRTSGATLNQLYQVMGRLGTESVHLEDRPYSD
jgi:uncharacterized protein YdcH (DUF465 family)